LDLGGDKLEALPTLRLHELPKPKEERRQSDDERAQRNAILHFHDTPPTVAELRPPHDRGASTRTAPGGPCADPKSPDRTQGTGPESRPPWRPDRSSPVRRYAPHLRRRLGA